MAPNAVELAGRSLVEPGSPFVDFKLCRMSSGPGCDWLTTRFPVPSMDCLLVMTLSSDIR